LDGLDALCRVLNLPEQFAHRRLLQHFADERNGRCNVWLHYVPWYLIGSAFIRSLQLVTCFSEVCGMLVDVFRAIVYLWQSRSHHRELTRFSRVNRNDRLLDGRFTIKNC
jgi:hypothetical protein